MVFDLFSFLLFLSLFVSRGNKSWTIERRMDLDKKMDKNLFESLFHVIAFKFQRADFIINRYKIKVNASILSIS